LQGVSVQCFTSSVMGSLEADGCGCIETQQIQSEKWAHVGAGKGAYERVTNLKYVGAGKGSINKEMLPATRMTGFCGVMLCLLVIPVVAGLAYLLYINKVPIAADVPVAQNVLPDCDLDFAEWEHKWNANKKEYCCAHVARGCPPRDVKYVPKIVYRDVQVPVPVHVRVPVPVPHVVTKQVYVKEPPPFQCKDDADVDSWTARHKRYCCYLKRMACFPVLVDHNVYHRVVQVKTVKVPHYLPPPSAKTHIKYKDVPYPVPAVPEVKTIKVPGEVIYRIRHVQVPKMVPVPTPGDVEVVRKPVAVQVPSKPIYVKMPPASHGQYDCSAGYSNWYFGWSKVKKRWCCDHRHRGCPGTWHGSMHLHAAHIAHGVGVATGKIYDCDAGFANWLQGWSDSKKKWCCSRKNKGCPKYYCGQHEHTWTPDKRRWCCANFQKGCLSTTLSSLGCDAVCSLHGTKSTCRNRMKWAKEHAFFGHHNACALAYSKVQVDCDICKACSIESAGCEVDVATSAAFDCDAAFNNFRRAWSPAKKHWCCTVQKKGCEGDSPPDADAGYGMVWKRVQVNGYWVWVAVHAGGVSLPYDCHAGLLHHLTGWSAGKKSWCCSHQHLGCGAGAGHVTVAVHHVTQVHGGGHGNPPGMAAAGMIWEWHDHWVQVHPDGTLPYHCHAGIKNWQAGWSLPKKQWCCVHVGVGCQ